MVLHFPKRRAFLPRAYDAETFPRLALPAHCAAPYAQLAIKNLCPWRIYSLPLTHTHPPSRLSKWGLGYSLACWAATFAGWFLRLKFQVWRLYPSSTTKSLLLDLGRSSALPKTGRREGRMWGRGIEPLYPPAKCWESWRPKCFLEIDWG